MIYWVGYTLTGIKECVRELFAFSKGRFNDLEAGNIGEKIANRLVWVDIVARLGVVAVLTDLAVQAVRLRYRIHFEIVFADFNCWGKLCLLEVSGEVLGGGGRGGAGSATATATVWIFLSGG